jgi:hypothetical protein
LSWPAAANRLLVHAAQKVHPGRRDRRVPPGRKARRARKDRWDHRVPLVYEAKSARLALKARLGRKARRERLEGRALPDPPVSAARLVRWALLDHLGQPARQDRHRQRQQQARRVALKAKSAPPQECESLRGRNP